MEYIKGPRYGSIPSFLAHQRLDLRDSGLVGAKGSGVQGFMGFRVHGLGFRI